MSGRNGSEDRSFVTDAWKWGKDKLRTLMYGNCPKCSTPLILLPTASKCLCPKCQIEYTLFQETPTCNFPGCKKKCYEEGNGRIHQYCGRTHAREHQEMVKQYQQRQQEWWAAHDQSHANSSYYMQNRGSQGFQNVSGYRSYRHTGKGPIKFYNREDPYYEFTNFYHAEVSIDGKMWPTTEHYFQAQKFVGTPYLERIRSFPRPRDAFSFTRDPRISRWRRKDWEAIKVDVMHKALIAKFSQHPNLSYLLLETGKKELIEDSPHDSFWGIGADGRGQNQLGKLLMKVRSELQNEKSASSPSAPSKTSRAASQGGDNTATKHRSRTSSESSDGGEKYGTPTGSPHGSPPRERSNLMTGKNDQSGSSSHSHPPPLEETRSHGPDGHTSQHHGSHLNPSSLTSTPHAAVNSPVDQSTTTRSPCGPQQPQVPPGASATTQPVFPSTQPPVANNVHALGQSSSMPPPGATTQPVFPPTHNPPNAIYSTATYPGQSSSMHPPGFTGATTQPVFPPTHNPPNAIYSTATYPGQSSSMPPPGATTQPVFPPTHNPPNAIYSTATYPGQSSSMPPPGFTGPPPTGQANISYVTQPLPAVHGQFVVPSPQCGVIRVQPNYIQPQPYQPPTQLPPPNLGPPPSTQPRDEQMDWQSTSKDLINL